MRPQRNDWGLRKYEEIVQNSQRMPSRDRGRARLCEKGEEEGDSVHTRCWSREDGAG